MLFTESARDPATSLPALSERISVAILRVGQVLDGALNLLSTEEQTRLWPIVKESIPPALFETAAMSERARERLPWPYQRSCITSGLASRLVYREGLAFVESLPEDGLADYAMSYLKGEQRAKELSAMVAAAGLACGAEIEALLLKGGVRAATEAFLTPAKAKHGEPGAYPVDAA